MPYEIDFIGINKGTKDTDAICFRFLDEEQDRYIVGVYDGGTNDYGEALTEHLNKYYFKDVDNPCIDFVVCSHSDQDHSAGLSIILENFEVKSLYFNRPWNYIDELFEKVNDGRITKSSLEERLRKAYKHIDNLEKTADEKGIPTYEAFEGEIIEEKLLIASPTKEFYLDLIVESNKTPLEEAVEEKGFAAVLKRAIAWIKEKWGEDSLREDVKTTAENETSVILYGEMTEEGFLLTGDAGIRALRKAIDYLNDLEIDPTDLKLYQIPHHGSRHNVSPSILNDLIGSIKSEGSTHTKDAIVSVAKESDHPRKMVVNAFIRRGARVTEARTTTICHSKNTPDREGWTTAKNIPFNDNVEDWN